MSELIAKIEKVMREVAADNEIELDSDINSETVLLDSGLDSLGFAILVAELDDQLGVDPFVLMEDPVYPRTFGEFVEIYQNFVQ